MMRTCALILSLMVCLGGAAAAQMPPLLSYQGVLTDATGTAVPDGTYSITFRIYDVGGTGGTALWSEPDYVTVTKGTFNALLGGAAMLSILPFDKTYYIGLSVEGGPELPRQVLTRSPYAFSAHSIHGTDNVFPSTGKVGIGTTAPAVPLHVTSASGQIGIQFDGYDDSWASMYVNAARPSAAAGFGYNRLGVLGAFTYLDAANEWHLRMGGSTSAINASPTGNVSIGALPPSVEKLSIDGALKLGNSAGSTAGTIRWSGSDFEGYNGSVWKSFTDAGAGLPAGSAGHTLRHNGADWVAAANLYNDGSAVGIGTTSPEATLHVNGDARIGSVGATGSVRLYRGGQATPFAASFSDANGGYVETYDEAYSLLCAFRPSWYGSGGVLGVTRTGDYWGLYVDGNSNGTGQPAVSIMGSDRFAIFDMSQEGENSVWLPLESVSSAETSDEPGVASYTSQYGVALGTSLTTIASQSITTPGAGYVLVIATCNLGIAHVNGVASHGVIGTSDNDLSFPDNQDLYVDYPATAATGSYLVPATCHGLYYNAYGGTFTYYLLGIRTNGAYTSFENQLSLVYIPTAYGSVQPTLASTGSSAEKTPGAALTAQEVAAQKSASEAANTARIEKELQEMRARLATLETRVKKE